MIEMYNLYPWKHKTLILHMWTLEYVWFESCTAHELGQNLDLDIQPNQYPVQPFFYLLG